MENEPSPVEIEVNPPSQENLFSGQPQAMSGLSGNPINAEIPLQQSPGAVFTIGPDGQMILVENPPFSWKQFGFGAGIPLLLLLAPLFALIISEDNHDWNWDSRELTLDSGTEYSLELEYPKGVYVTDCNMLTSDTNRYYDVYYSCNFDGGDIEIISYEEGERTIVGNWSNSTGTIVFDDGYNWTWVTFEYGTLDCGEPTGEVCYHDGDVQEVFASITGIMCLIVPILSIILLAVGFSTGRKGLGMGGVTSLIAYPFVAFFGCLAVIEYT
tara:strand:- start:1442 stop:2251 length:810 start_codon:yes stop_codon:yes gene_type:complete